MARNNATKYIQLAKEIAAMHIRYNMESYQSLDTGLDCSGFISYCLAADNAYSFETTGVTPRYTTVSMVSDIFVAANNFQKLPFSSILQVKEGDILVWNDASMSGGANGHTAMYIGNNQLA